MLMFSIFLFLKLFSVDFCISMLIAFGVMFAFCVQQTTSPIGPRYNSYCENVARTLGRTHEAALNVLRWMLRSLLICCSVKSLPVAWWV